MHNIFFTLFALLCGLSACTAQPSKYQSLDIDSFKQTINDTNTILLDVRTASEYAEGHLGKAINIDVQRDDFLQRAMTILPKDKSIAVYCRSGRRSKKAADLLADKGYRITELDNGYMGWTAAGNEVTKEVTDLFVTPMGTLVWLNCIKHGTLSICVGNLWIYIDPVTDKIPPTTDYSTRPKARLILLTHEHADHLDAKAIDQLSQSGTQLVANPRCSELLGGKGNVLKNGESTAIGTWMVEAVPAYNTAADKQQFHPKGRDNGYILTIDRLRIYIAGDTEDIAEMNDIHDIDVAFLPCNLPYTMTPEQLAHAAKMLSPKVLFPYHYGQTDIQQVQQLLAGSGIDIRIRPYQ